MMRRVSSFAGGLMLLASAVSARTGANASGAAPIDVFESKPVATAPQAAMPASTMAVFAVPLPAGAEQVDSTYYDLQDMGSLGSRIAIAADGTVHVTFEKDFCELGGGCPPNLSAPDPFPNRGMGYAYRSGGIWSHPGKVADARLHCSQCVPEKVGGFGALSLAPTGLVSVAAHANEDGCSRRGDMYLADNAAASTWRGYLPPIPQPPVDPEFLEFPQVSANPNGSFTLIAESPRTGAYDGVTAFRTSYLAAPGTVFSCPIGWQMGAWTPTYNRNLFPHHYPGDTSTVIGFPALAHSSNGRVGIAVADVGGNVYLIESSNGTFAAATLTTRTLTNYADATITAADSTSTQYRPFIHCALAYNDTTPHVVWSELQRRREGGVIYAYDWRSRIMHWDPVRGAEVVKQVAAGEADSYTNIDRGLRGPLPGLNTISVDWPQVGFSADGSETYVAWLRFSDAEVDTSAHINLPGICTGVGYGDIAASVARAGQAWSAPQNITSTPATDERFFSLAARNTGGRVHVVFQAAATNQAGDVVFGDRGNTNRTQPNAVLLRRIAYLERTLTSSIVAVPLPDSRLFASSMIAAPNPAPSQIRFALHAGAMPAAGARVEIFSVNGRRMASVAAGRDGAFEWDGRDGSGRRAMAGVYFARLSGGVEMQPVRFTLLR